MDIGAPGPQPTSTPQKAGSQPIHVGQYSVLTGSLGSGISGDRSVHMDKWCPQARNAKWVFRFTGEPTGDQAPGSVSKFQKHPNGYEVQPNHSSHQIHSLTLMFHPRFGFSVLSTTQLHHLLTFSSSSWVSSHFPPIHSCHVHLFWGF